MIAKLPTRLSVALAIAAGYALMGLLGAALSPRASDATAIWPASGVALAAMLLYGYRAWPAVFLGALVINLWIYGHAIGIESLGASLSVALPISLGAVVQAAAGALLIRRTIGFPNALKHEADIIQFLLLGGPFSCTIGPTFGITTMTLAGLVPASGFWANWLMWWLGDSIGVILFTPLVLIFFARPRSQWRSRKIPVALPLAISFALVVAIFVFATGQEANQRRLEFQQRAETLSRALQLDIARDIEIVRGIRTYFDHAERVSRRAFHDFTGASLENRPHLRAIAWIARIPAEGRRRFEGETRAEGIPSFEVSERDGQGIRVPAGKAEDYAVVSYIEPYAENATAHGVNLLSSEAARHTLYTARDTGTAGATVRQGPGGTISRIEIYVPVYARGATPGTVIERRQKLQGFVAGIIDLERLLNALPANVDRRDLSIVIRVPAVDGASDAVASGIRGGDAKAPPALQWTQDLHVADRTFELVFSQPAVSPAKSWATWYLLVGGFVFTGLLGAFLLILTGRTTRISEVVAEKTADISNANRALIREIWERKSIEKALEQAKNDAEFANQAKSDFLASVSHELRTPLNGILGFAQILQKDGRLLPDQREQIDIISECGRNLLTLINDMLDLSRIEADRLVTENRPFVLPDLVGFLVDMFTLRAQAKHIEFRYEAQTPLPYGLSGDEKRLRQVLINLLTNAVKFTERGSVTFRVSYFKHTLRFQVEDTGCGIAESDLDRIFLPFQRCTHRTSAEEGSGLGLTISKKLVELMAGRLRVESAPGKGSLFEVEVNLAEVAIAHQAAQDTRRIFGYPGRRRRILIVDDIPANRSLLQGMLAPLGFVTETAGGGLECLEKVPIFLPDAILMDLIMADLDGLETARRLRQSPSGQRTAIIGISASAFSWDKERCLAAGCDDFIAKPVQLEHLLDCLKNHLDLTWLSHDPASV